MVKEEKRMFSETGDKFIMAGIVILIITTLSLLVVSLEENKKECVSLNECNKPAGEFSIQPNTNVAETINECGLNGYGRGTEPCIIRGIQNVSQAIEQCNRLSDICNKFIYPDTSGNETMRIVSLNGVIEKHNSTHSFIRQVGITFREN
jgi:hypothetical protein